MGRKIFTLSALTLGVMIALTGCNDDDDDKTTNNTSKETTTTRSLTFTSVHVPETDEDKRKILASPSVNINGTNYDIGYKTILRSGDQAGNWRFGQLIDFTGNPLYNADGTPNISNSNDFASLLPVGDKIFMVSHFESRPGAMYLTELNQDVGTGELSPVSTRPIDFSGIRGGWVHCAGSVTPWNSHLGSEEYEPMANKVDLTTGSMNSYYDAMGAYYGGNLLELNPYDYGFNIEVKVLDEAGTTSVAKHYAMGRLAFELSYVMPDQKTAYMTDDGTNVGFYMFIADTEGDLSAGTLYAMKWNQTSAENGGSADVEWISLGHATNDEIAGYISSRIKFSDIFDKVEPSGEGECPAGFTSINAGHESDEFGNYHQCLSLKPGMEKVASRLETRRYAAMLGATTEIRKEEGVTYNPDNNKLYVAISEISRGMENNQKSGKDNTTYDAGGYNHIQVEYNTCGGVYELDLASNSSIGSDYVAINMKGMITGTMKDYSGTNLENNVCDVDGLANPDNVTYIPQYDTLIIGEDTGSGHQNDIVWSYNLTDKSLTRIQTTPYGSETTSPYVYTDINGWGYIMSVVQHPYGESDEDKSTGAADNAAYTGYIGPFPAFK